MESSLTTPVQYLPRVGPVMAKRLEKLEIRTIDDLLFYPPFRYNDYSLVSPINRIQAGETVTIRGEVTSIKNVITKSGKKLQQAKVADETDEISVIWFNQPFLLRVIHVGDRLSLAGKADWWGHEVVMVGPEYEIIEEEKSLHTGRLVPVYSETAGVSSKWLRTRINFALEKYLNHVADPLPNEILQQYNLISLQKTLQNLHFPQNPTEAAAARWRLGFDELLSLQLTGRLLRQERESRKTGYSLKLAKKEIVSFINSLPFKLTNDQNRAVNELLSDLTKDYPANHLLVGDVGSGKTVVAAIAMYAVFRSGTRSVLMAPTEILAQQHFQTISQFLSPLGITVGLRTGSTKNPEPDIKDDVLIGTHALLSKTVKLKDVALIVIDEQHRFGVRQRSFLTQKNTADKIPHLLTMTATPIPRTIALTALGNLDVSFLNELPWERQRVKTWVVPREKREAAYNWIKKQIKQTRGQVFIIYPLIEASENLASLKAATKEYEHLQKEIFAEFHLGLLHGRLKSKEKQKVLDAFRANKTQILVATPVVEVGIDIPNATIMVIEGADRFGLGQLHQLRGRVGRGILSAYCLLFTEIDDPGSLERLTAMEKMSGGPELAEIDLRLRGPGELFGVQQHGLPAFKFADLFNQKLVSQAQTAAQAILADHPNLIDLPLLRERLKTDIIITSQD